MRCIILIFSLFIFVSCENINSNNKETIETEQQEILLGETEMETNLAPLYGFAYYQRFNNKDPNSGEIANINDNSTTTMHGYYGASRVGSSGVLPPYAIEWIVMLNENYPVRSIGVLMYIIVSGEAAEITYYSNKIEYTENGIDWIDIGSIQVSQRNALNTFDINKSIKGVKVTIVCDGFWGRTGSMICALKEIFINGLNANASAIKILGSNKQTKTLAKNIIEEGKIYVQLENIETLATVDITDALASNFRILTTDGIKALVIV